jgi:hypothetical protein
MFDEYLRYLNVQVLEHEAEYVFHKCSKLHCMEYYLHVPTHPLGIRHNRKIVFKSVVRLHNI